MRKLLPFLLGAGLLIPAPASAAVPVAEETFYEYLTVFESAFVMVRRDAVEAVDGERLIKAAIAGMLSSLDPRAAYFDKEALFSQESGADRVGLAVTRRRGAVEVIAPRDGSPAAAAGILGGDVVLTIGRQPAAAMSLSEFEKRLKGPPGSVVRLHLERRGADRPFEVSLKRADFRLRTVRDRLFADIGYVRLAGFDAATPVEIRAAIEDLRNKSGGKLEGLILDLRNNPGGEFAAAAAVAEEFLDAGVIALIEGRKRAPKPLPARGTDLAAGLPMVALINGGTAGEAELVAGALKDNRRAVLIGTRSFGENAILTMIPLEGGGAIRLATARFLTPRGRNIAGRGIAPDIRVTPIKLEKLDAGIPIREADLPGNPNRQAAIPARREETASLSALEPQGDEPLLRALDILRAFLLTAKERD